PPAALGQGRRGEQGTPRTVGQDPRADTGDPRDDEVEGDQLISTRSPASELPLETTLRLSLPFDLRRTLWPVRRGLGDPCMREDPAGAWWRATRTPQGPATTRFECLPSSGEVEVRAWGPGARWALEFAP